MRKCIYLTEGECEEKLIKALKEKPALIVPGKVKKFNVVQDELPVSLLMQFEPGSIGLLDDVIRLIAKGDQQQRLMEDYDDHELSGDWKGHRELHVLSDWLLVYYLEENVLVLTLSRTGTHSDIFKK